MCKTRGFLTLNVTLTVTFLTLNAVTSWKAFCQRLDVAITPCVRRKAVRLALGPSTSTEKNVAGTRFIGIVAVVVLQ